MLQRAQDLLKIEANNPSFVFKKCCFPNTLVILKKLPISITTENRKDVINDKYAQFRANKLLVVKIVSLPDLQELEECRSLRNFYFEYRKNEIVEAYDFEMDIEIVSGKGIHYFKTIVAALNFGFNILDDHFYYDGIWYNYNYNGKLLEIYNLKSGKMHGLQTMFSEDGTSYQYLK